MMSLFSFSDNWVDLAAHYPKEFIERVEQRYALDHDWKKYIKMIKYGVRADKTFSKKGSKIKPGEWVVRSYSRYLVGQVLKAIRRGRFVKKGDR